MPDLLDEFLSGLPDPALIVDNDLRIRSANAAAVNNFGNRLVGESLLATLRQPDVFDCIEQARSTGDLCETRVRMSEELLDLSFRFAARVIPHAGSHFGFPEGCMIVTLSDMSGSEAVEQVRRDFVANVSHELRSPLTSLIGIIETVSRLPDRPAVLDRFMPLMHQEVERMAALVRDLLSLSRVEAMERMPPTDSVSLERVLKEAMNSAFDDAEQAGVSIDLDSADLAGMVVIGDSEQLTQVFRNLLENAINYGSDGGKVMIRTSCQDRNGEKYWQLDVVDMGEGIEQEHLHRLTERFYRVDSHRSREVGGTGLGLAIVKHIVNRHRGRLQISSEPGTGSQFSVLLPADCSGKRNMADRSRETQS